MPLTVRHRTDYRALSRHNLLLLCLGQEWIMRSERKGTGCPLTASVGAIAIAPPPHVESEVVEHAAQLAGWENDGGASMRAQPTAVPQLAAVPDP